MSVKIFGSTGIEFSDSNQEIKIKGPTQTFSLKATTDDEFTVYNAANKLWGMSSAGHQSSPNTVIVHGRGRASNGSTVSGTYAPMNFTVVDSNIGGGWNNSNATFTTPVSGYYRIQGTNGNASGGNNNQYISIYVLVNDVVVNTGWSRNAGYDRTAHVEITWNLTAGDTVKFTYHTGYGAVPSYDYMSSFSVVLISAT